MSEQIPAPARRKRRIEQDTVRGRLRPHDPFELIRWLALSQPDPRKALAELVQNALDAGARSIRVVRARERGVACLSILDDGEGIIPELDRPEALRYIATHVGHSRKKSLSPQQRLELMTQGQYGIGLLGFWSLGATLEMKSVLPGQRGHKLVLHRDRPDFLIEPLRGRLPIDERWTRVVVAGLHRESMSVLGARRAADFLAAELRGQLLSRNVDLVIEDRMSRGRSQKVVAVRPPRFLGERIDGLTSVEVPGSASIKLEIYVAAPAGDDRATGPLAVYCSGTLVAESFEELGSLGLDHSPWTDPRLTGLVDFPAFQVTPGSRRGFVPDAAAGAFARALAGLEPALLGFLEALERRREEILDRDMVRDLQRAFKDFYRQRPRYEMLPVQPRREEPPSGLDGDGGAGAVAAGVEVANDADEALPVDQEPDLLPPGPLAQVRLTPSPVRVECRGTRRARAAALDADGRQVEGLVAFDWQIEGDVGELEVSDESRNRVTLHAAAEPATGTLRVRAHAGERQAEAGVEVEVVTEIPSGRAEEGIPEPDLVDAGGAPWRSRLEDGRWQVNIGHRDYRALEGRPALKLRYLAMLFAKEVVLRSSQDPRLERPLEQVVEVVAFADRELAGRRGSAPRRPRAGNDGEA